GWTFAPDAKLNADQMKAFKAGELYVNVHSAANPGGEIRRQLQPEDRQEQGSRGRPDGRPRFIFAASPKYPGAGRSRIIPAGNPTNGFGLVPESIPSDAGIAQSSIYGWRR